MTETFELPGSDKTPRGRRTGTWVVLALLGLGVLGLIVKALYDRPAGSSADRSEALLRQAEQRKTAFARLAPGGRVPDPFYLRGAATGGGAGLVWMLRDFDASHAFLLGADTVPEAALLAQLLTELGGERMPQRQRLDEPGVLPEKRPPFTEEYRSIPLTAADVQPPRAWAEAWSEAVQFRFPDGSAADLALRLDANTAFPLSPWRRDGDYAWAIADLSARTPGSRLFLVYFLPTSSSTSSTGDPESGPVYDFGAAVGA